MDEPEGLRKVAVKSGGSVVTCSQWRRTPSRLREAKGAGFKTPNPKSVGSVLEGKRALSLIILGQWARLHSAAQAWLSGQPSHS